MGEVYACQMVLRCVPVPAARCSLSSCASSSSPARTSSSRLTASRPSTCVQGRAVSTRATPAHCHSAHPGACSQHKRATPARAHGSAGGTSCCHSTLAGGGTPPESAEPPRPQSRAPQAAGVVGCGLGRVVGCGRGGLRPRPADLGAIDMLEHAAGELLVGDRVLLLRVAERRARSELREARGAPGSQHRLGVLLPGVRHALDAGGRVQVGLLLGHHPHELVHPETVGAQLGHRRDLLRSRVQV